MALRVYITTPEYPRKSQTLAMLVLELEFAFLNSRETEIAVPSWHQDHVISKVFALNLGFLENNNIGFQDVKHRLQI